MAEHPDGAPVRRDPSGLVILLVLCALEVAILYLLIAVETPLAPLVRKAIQNPGGLVAVVMSAVTVLCIGMAVFLSLLTRRRRGDTPTGESRCD